MKITHDEELKYIIDVFGFLFPVFSNVISNMEFASLISSYYDIENDKIRYCVEFLKKCHGYSFQRKGSLMKIHYPNNFIEDSISDVINAKNRLINDKSDFTDEQKEQIKIWSDYEKDSL